MRLPEIFVVERYGTRLIRRTMVQQSAVHNQPSVGCFQPEAKGIGRIIPTQMHGAPVVLPAFEFVEAPLQRIVAKIVSILLGLAEPLFAMDYHTNLSL